MIKSNTEKTPVYQYTPHYGRMIFVFANTAFNSTHLLNVATVCCFVNKYFTLDTTYVCL